VNNPLIRIVHHNLWSSVKCPCGFAGSYHSYFRNMRGSYASSKAAVAAMRHGGTEHDGRFRTKEETR
jgi:hypothetical protein